MTTTSATVDLAPAAPVQTPPRVGFTSFLRELVRRKPLGAIGGAVFMLFVFCGLFANFLAPYGVNATDLRARLEAPSLSHFFGTDHIGRDVFSRVLMGAQVSMTVAVATSAIATMVSVALGAIAGYFGGRLDALLQRFVDAWMTFPDLVLLIVVISVLGAGATQIILILGLLYGIGGSRIVRGAVLSVRENTYTRAAQSIGAGWGHIIWRHILPNIAPVVIVIFTTRIGAVILVEAGLSFLGLGVPPPAPTWGGMLSGTGRTYMYVGPWLALAPGLCLAAAVYSVNIFGDALRDLLDPRMRGRR